MVGDDSDIEKTLGIGLAQDRLDGIEDVPVILVRGNKDDETVLALGLGHNMISAEKGADGKEGHIGNGQSDCDEQKPVDNEQNPPEIDFHILKLFILITSLMNRTTETEVADTMQRCLGKVGTTAQQVAADVAWQYEDRQVTVGYETIEPFAVATGKQIPVAGDVIDFQRSKSNSAFFAPSVHNKTA